MSVEVSARPNALTDAGTSANDAAIVRAADCLLEQEVRTPGDWAVRQPGLGLGGWAFEFANDNYPDVDDTAEGGLDAGALPSKVWRPPVGSE